VPIVTDLLVCVAQWYARMLIRYRLVLRSVAGDNVGGCETTLAQDTLWLNPAITLILVLANVIYLSWHFD